MAGNSSRSQKKRSTPKGNRRNAAQRSDRKWNIEELRDIKLFNDVVCVKVKWEGFKKVTWNDAAEHNFDVPKNKDDLIDLLNRLLNANIDRTFDEETLDFLTDLNIDLEALRRKVAEDQEERFDDVVTEAERRAITLYDFDVANGVHLARGVYGSADKVQFRNNGEFYVLKKIDRTWMIRKNYEHLLVREIANHRILKHPNIVRMHTHFNHGNYTYLVLDLAERGDLFTERNMVGGYFKERVAARYTHQLASALLFCHAKMIIHSDLKLENILIGSDGRLLLADFGHSFSAKIMRSEFERGTHRAPELFNEKRYGKEIDLWSLGHVIFEMVMGYGPFAVDPARGVNHDDQDRIRECRYYVPRHNRYDRYVSNQAASIICSLLVKDPKHRLPLDCVLTDAWIRRYVV